MHHSKEMWGFQRTAILRILPSNWAELMSACRNGVDGAK